MRILQGFRGDAALLAANGTQISRWKMIQPSALSKNRIEILFFSFIFDRIRSEKYDYAHAPSTLRFNHVRSVSSSIHA